MGFEIENGVLIRYHKENGVQSVTVPEGVTVIGQNAFYRNKAITQVFLPETVVRIEKEAFCFCTRLQSIILPESLMEIGEGAFSWCNRLLEVSMPPKLERIPDRAFLGCTALSRIVMPDRLKEIGISAFERCHNLLGMKLPEGLLSIRERAFFQCRHIGTLRIPPSVEYIGKLAAEYRPAVVHTPDGVPPAADQPTNADQCIVIGNGILYEYCGNDRFYRIPPNIRKIASGAFYAASNTIVFLPDTLCSIECDAFGVRQLLRLCREDVSVPLRFYRGSNRQMKENSLLMQFLTEADIPARENAFRQMRTADYKIPAAIFMTAAYDLPFYQEYLHHIGKRAVEYLMEYDDADTLMRILPKLPIRQKTIDSLIESAISGQHFQCQNLLLHYKSEAVGYGDMQTYFKL